MTAVVPARGRFVPVEVPPTAMPMPADTPLPRTRILDPLTWDEALPLYEAFAHAAGLSGRTIDNRSQVLAQLRKWVQVEPARVTLAQLLTMQRRPVAASTKQRNRSVYQGFFRWLFEEGYALDDPSKRLPKVRVPRATPRPVSVAQLEAALGRCRKRSTRTMILLGAYQGMRVAEISRIRGEMFDLDANQLVYVAKGGVRRVQELHPIVRGEVAHYPRHGYWFPGERPDPDRPHVHAKSVSAAIGRALRRAGVDSPNITAHSLRHFFGTELLAGGTDIRVVQELMGHAQLNSTAIYTHVPEQRMREGLASLPQVTLPGAHFSRAHRRAWVSVVGAADLLAVEPVAAAALAQAHGWRYTAGDDGTMIYAIADVEATHRGEYGRYVGAEWHA